MMKVREYFDRLNTSKNGENRGLKVLKRRFLEKMFFGVEEKSYLCFRER